MIINKRNSTFNSFSLINMNYVFFIITIILNLIKFTIEWGIPDVQPKFKFDIETERIHNFYGNKTDYFKILDQNDDTILIGARNAIYNLTILNLKENQNERIEWHSSDADRELCALKGKQENDCQNYIRVYAKLNDKQTIMLCGTNSYKPRCRYYIKNNNKNTLNLPEQNSLSSNDIHLEQKFEFIKEIEAQGRCPYSPKHNSTYLYTNDKLYSATVADFSGADPLIFRETLRTEQYDLKQLNQPAFISAVERDDYVFFFFREISMEYMNCGKAIYSRVGRVCKNDRGGPYAFSDRWTSFLKTRLNCSIPGEYPFYFDEIQSTSHVIEDNDDAIIYAVFTTSINAIPGSAVCAFSFNSILDSFNGRFKAQKDSNSNWLPVSQDRVPVPRPGQCVNDSRTLSSTSANFIKTHTLMEQSVSSIYNRPLLTRVSLNYRLTAITIDPKIQTQNNQSYDIIFVGTDDGKLIKFINIPPKTDADTKQNLDTDNDDDENYSETDDSANDNNQIKTIIIAEIQALPLGQSIRELTISHKSESIAIIGDGQILTLPLHYCSKLNCMNCLNIQDPYCAWDKQNQECHSIKNLNFVKENYIQNLNIKNSMDKTKLLCKNYGNSNNIDNNRLKPNVVPYSTRGTISGVGKQQHFPIQQNSESNQQNYHTQDNSDEIKNTIRIYHQDKITVTSISPDYIMNSLNGNNEIYPPEFSNGYPEEERLQLVTSSTQWSFLAVVVIIVFAVGIGIGAYTSNKCKFLTSFHSATNSEHHNQLSNHRHFTNRNSSKDINLLMNSTNIPTTNFSNVLPCQINNNKKDNIEHEFIVGVNCVDEKDRSHECKNSTENLEKDMHLSKTGTLTKVKRTYI